MLDYKSILSSDQYNAVVNYEGPNLVIAGAGSGKTRVLTYRIAYMIESGVQPYNILSLTFTNKAAAEMRERVSSVISESVARNVWLGTFHSIFRKILCREAEHIGFTDSYTIYDSSDCRSLIKTIIREMKLDEKKYEPKIVSNRISKAKNELLTPQMYASSTIKVGDDIKQGFGELHNIYRNYMIRCKQNNAMDFDDLLLYTNILFKNHPEVLAKYQQQFHYILVDEYQDTNSAQYLIVKRLAENHKNICVVGDDAQSIYSFRGAKIENILRFQKDYPNTIATILKENYRSTQTIVNAANCVISKNSSQIKKSVFSNKAIGDKIALRRSFTDKEEAQEIRRAIQTENEEGIAYKDIAILYRTNAQSKVIEDQLRLCKIPYKIHKGHSFYQHTEIKHILAYLRLISNSSDDEALKRIINFPTRGIGATSMDKIIQYAQERSISIWDAITLHPIDNFGIRGGALKGLTAFIEVIEKYQELSLVQNTFDVVYPMLGDSGILRFYKDSSDPEKESAYQNIEELVNSVKQQCEAYLSENETDLMLNDWIQDVMLLTTDDNKENEDDDVNNKVTLMTIHSAKGLEFDTVIIVGVEEGIFPAQKSAEEIQGLEEERRLFYVAVTRAIRKLIVSYSLSRYQWGNLTNTIPSRFIGEVDDKFYDCPDLKTARNAYTNEPKASYSPSAGSRYSGNSYSGYSSQSNDMSGLKATYSSNTFSRKEVQKPVAMPRSSASSVDVGNMKKVAIRTTETVSVSEQGGIKLGDRVKHDRFGVGTVKTMEQTTTDTRICVEFDVSGEKNLLMKFAKLLKV